MISSSTERRPHMWVPAFWSSQFGVNIKSVGVPSMGEEILITQGSLAERRFTGAYGYQGRVIGAVTFDNSRWLQFYQGLIETAAPFPPTFLTVDRRPEGRQPVPADFPDPSLPTHGPTVTLSGYSSADRRLVFKQAHPDHRCGALQPAARGRIGPICFHAPRTRHDASPAPAPDHRLRQPRRPVSAVRGTPQDPGVAGRGRRPVRHQHVLGHPEPAPRPADQLRRLQSHRARRRVDRAGGGGSAAQLPAARPSGPRPAASDDQPSVRPTAQPPTCLRHAWRARRDRLRPDHAASGTRTGSMWSTSSRTPFP